MNKYEAKAVSIARRAARAIKRAERAGEATNTLKRAATHLTPHDRRSR